MELQKKKIAKTKIKCRPRFGTRRAYFNRETCKTKAKKNEVSDWWCHLAAVVAAAVANGWPVGVAAQ